MHVSKSETETVLSNDQSRVEGKEGEWRVGGGLLENDLRTRSLCPRFREHTLL